MSQRKSIRQQRRGFTLIELLVSLVLVAIVSIATFSFMSSISTVFSVQQQVTDATSNLRFSMDIVGNDVKRAGYLGTANMAREVGNVTDDDGICPNPSGLAMQRISAVRIENDDSGAYVYGDNDNDNIEPDALTVVGAFSHNEAFPVGTVVNTTLNLDPTELQRIMGADTLEDTKPLFLNLFREKRLARVWKPGAPAQLAHISLSKWDEGGLPVVEIPRLVTSGNAQCGIEGVAAHGYKVSVLEIVRYHVVQDPSDERKMDLMRTELDPTTGNVLRIDGQFNNEVPVAEYVVDFQVWADGDVRSDVNNDVLPVIGNDQVGDDEGGLRFSYLEGGLPSLDRWHRVRTLHIELAVRTPREDPRWLHRPRARQAGNNGGVIYGPIVSVNLDDEEVGAARVVSMTNSIEVSNLTFRNLQ
jgi:prepilin-type N-terminal cleavage/methylation domain-containing protein